METSERDSSAPLDGAGELVTVLIPARNEEHTITSCLRSVLAQSYDAIEALVVDGASDDSTRAVVEQIAQEDARVRLLHNPRRTIPTALNIGLEAAAGRWLVRIDAHSTVPPDYVERAVGHLRSAPWGGVGGRKDGVGVTDAGRAIAAALGSRFGVGGSVYHHGSERQVVDHIPFGVYSVELLRQLGGWNQSLFANEDFELDLRIRRAGRELLFDPELRIDWRCRQSIGGLFRQYQRYGGGKALVVRLHPESLKPRHLAPALLVGMLGGLILNRRKRTAALMLLPYATFVALATASVARKLEDRAARRWLPLVFPAMHLGYGIGFLWALVSRPKAESTSEAPLAPEARRAHPDTPQTRCAHLGGPRTQPLVGRCP